MTREQPQRHERRREQPHTRPGVGESGSEAASQGNSALQKRIGELEQQLAEEKERRRKSEMLLATAQQEAHLGSWEWNLEHDHFIWTEELYRIHGRSPADFTPTRAAFLAHVHPEDRPEVEEALTRVRDEGTAFELHHRIVRADGIVRILRSQGHRVRGEEESGRVFGVAQDVTEARQTEIALRQSEKQYRLLAHHMPDAAVILYDPELRVTLVEGTIAPYSTYTALEIEGRDLLTLLPPFAEGVTKARQSYPYRQALRGEPQAFELERADRTLQIHALPIKDENGHISGGMIMLQDITRQKKVQARLVKTARQRAALNEMGQTVAASLELEIVFERVVEALRPLLRAEGVAILLRQGKDRLRVAAGSQSNEVGLDGLAHTALSSHEGIAGVVIRTGESQWRASPDPLLEIYPEINEGAAYKPRAILAVPLHLHGELIGVMEAIHSRPDVFQEDDLMTLEAAANWTAIAIGNARQHARLQRRLRESEAMAAISRSLSETLDMQHLLERIADATRQLLPAVAWAAVYLLDAEGQKLFPAAVSGLEIDNAYLLDPSTNRGDGAGPKRPAGGARQQLAEMGEHPGSLLVIPLETHQGRSGILSVQRNEPQSFTDNDEALLRTLGLQAAMAIENARLFTEQQRARQTAEILRAANVALSQTLNLDTVLDTLLDYVRELIGYQRANVLLLSQDRDSFGVRAWRGYTEEEIAVKESAMFTYANIKRVLQAQQPQLIADIGRQADWVHLPGREEEQGSWLGIPLLIGGEIIGILSMIKLGINTFSEQQMMLGEALAAQAASAVQNARLFTEVESGRERLRYLTTQIVNAQEKERQRISRELHDEAGQALTALKISLEMMRGGWPELPGEVTSQLEEAIQLIDQTMDQIRLLAHNLRPPVLDTLGLVPSVEGLCRNFSRRTRLPISFEAQAAPPLPEAVTISVYRFVQEALTNVAKHARATEITVELHYDNDMISISVADNGQGFDVQESSHGPERSGGIGLSGMQDRFELLNGWVTVDSQPGQGTCVVAHVPYEEDQ